MVAERQRRRRGTLQALAYPAYSQAVRVAVRQSRPPGHAIDLLAASAAVGQFTSDPPIPPSHRPLPRRPSSKLAEADAFASLGLSRREALWQVMELDDAQLPLFDDLDDTAPSVRFAHATPCRAPRLPHRPFPPCPSARKS